VKLTLSVPTKINYFEPKKRSFFPKKKGVEQTNSKKKGPSKIERLYATYFSNSAGLIERSYTVVLDLFRHLIFLEKVEDSNQTTIVPFEALLFLSLFFLLDRSAKFCIVSFLHVCLAFFLLDAKQMFSGRRKSFFFVTQYFVRPILFFLFENYGC
jgi:hypothetical protein